MISAAIIASWVAVDWGTSRLRAWAMSPDGAVLAGADSEDGMGQLARSDFEPKLLALINSWLGTGKTSVIICGMAGSRQGWVEAPYQAAPCAALGGALTGALSKDPRLDVHLNPGIMQSHPADVMRGEETQIAGYLAQNPGFEGVLCLPGTHCKWVKINAGKIISFRTFMTGELFALLGRKSVLRSSIVADGWDESAFLGAVADVTARPETLAAQLFSLRAETLLCGLSGSAARARLSGALIGAELAAARPFWLDQSVVIVSEKDLGGIYQAALATQGPTPQIIDSAAMTIAGLTAIHEMLNTHL